jgi:hypothetical protein
MMLWTAPTLRHQGYRYLRWLLIVAVISYARSHGAEKRPWLGRLMERRPTKVAAVAFARVAGAFSIVDPAGTWAWRSGPVDAAAVRQGAVLALQPAEAAVQLRAEAAVVELPRRAEAPAQLREAAVAELPRRAAAPVQLRAEAAVVELPRRAEAPVQLRAEAAELPRRAAAAVELAPCAAAAYQRRRYP